MRRLDKALISGSLAVLVLPYFLLAQASFFPTRPTNRASLKVAEGILLDYGVGNKSGSFSIRDAKTGKEIDFYVGNNIRGDGRAIHCQMIPTDGSAPDPRICESWPSAIRAGHTKVKVTYWETKHDEGKGPEMVKVSDQIEVAK
jgi:hypothetical protein